MNCFHPYPEYPPRYTCHAVAPPSPLPPQYQKRPVRVKVALNATGQCPMCENCCWSAGNNPNIQYAERIEYVIPDYPPMLPCGGYPAHSAYHQGPSHAQNWPLY